MTYIVAYRQSDRWRNFLSWGSIFTEDPNLCQVDRKTSQQNFLTPDTSQNVIFWEFHYTASCLSTFLYTNAGFLYLPAQTPWNLSEFSEYYLLVSHLCPTYTVSWHEDSAHIKRYHALVLSSLLSNRQDHGLRNYSPPKWGGQGKPEMLTSSARKQWGRNTGKDKDIYSLKDTDSQWPTFSN